MNASKPFNLEEIFARLKVNKRDEPKEVLNLPPGRFLDEGYIFARQYTILLA